MQQNGSAGRSAKPAAKKPAANDGTRSTPPAAAAALLLPERSAQRTASPMRPASAGGVPKGTQPKVFALISLCHE